MHLELNLEAEQQALREALARAVEEAPAIFRESANNVTDDWVVTNQGYGGRSDKPIVWFFIDLSEPMSGYGVWGTVANGRLYTTEEPVWDAPH